MNNTEDLLSVYFRFLFIKLVDFVISRVDQKFIVLFFLHLWELENLKG